MKVSKPNSLHAVGHSSSSLSPIFICPSCRCASHSNQLPVRFELPCIALVVCEDKNFFMTSNVSAPKRVGHLACVRVMQDKGTPKVHILFVQHLSSRLPSGTTNYTLYVRIYEIHNRYAMTVLPEKRDIFSIRPIQETLQA